MSSSTEVAVSEQLQSRKRPAPSDEDEDVMQELILHTRNCNKREVCSCKLRLESRKFHQRLKLQRTRVARLAAPRGIVKVSNVQQFDVAVKAHIVELLAPVDLAVLSMVNHQWRKDVEDLAEKGTKNYVSAESRKGKVIVTEKAKHHTWSRHLHLQMHCVHKLFVYYTAYKTGEMRAATPQWAFGVVDVDPSEPMKAIMPNAWKFQGHSPWLKRKSNGKGGEWMLSNAYKIGKAPKDFVQKVNEWASTIRVGGHLSVSFQQPDSTEVNWWEAQVWYVWRADGREEPVTVYDAANDQEHEVHPRDLVEYFRANPTHVVDVCTTSRSICRDCTQRGKNFHFCHVTKGHAMV